MNALHILHSDISNDFQFPYNTGYGKVINLVQIDGCVEFGISLFSSVSSAYNKSYILQRFTKQHRSRIFQKGVYVHDWEVAGSEETDFN